MARKTGSSGRNDFRDAPGFFGWLNRRLFPYIGPPPIGPYDNERPEPDRRAAPCPICHQALSEHTFDRAGTGPTKIHCPTGPTASR